MKFISLGMNEKICKRSEARGYMANCQQNTNYICEIMDLLMSRKIPGKQSLVHLAYNLKDK